MLDVMRSLFSARRKVAPGKGSAGHGRPQQALVKAGVASDSRSDGGECRRLGDIETLSCSSTRASTKGSDVSVSLQLSLSSTKASIHSPRDSGIDTSSTGSLSPRSAGSALSQGSTGRPCTAACWPRIGQARPRRSHTSAHHASAHHLPQLVRRKWTIDDFEVVKTIGLGFMGSVRVVRSSGARGSAPFALKVMRKDQIIEKKQVEHVMQESALLGRVSHPFIVKLVATFQDSAHLFMLMEYVNGGELWSKLAARTRLKKNEAKFFAAEVTLALGHLHGMCIAYRDLKPENILLDREGHVKLIDFGFAKVVTELTWTKCGTAEYMAPEVIIHHGHGMPVDWWALGILIYEMLAGVSPFAAPTNSKVHTKVLHVEPEYPVHFTSNTRAIVDSLLRKNVADRLGSVEEVKRQTWFAYMDWEMLLQRKIAPPFVPNLLDDGDTSFYSDFPEVDIGASTGVDLSAEMQQLFEGF